MSLALSLSLSLSRCLVAKQAVACFLFFFCLDELISEQNALQATKQRSVFRNILRQADCAETIPQTASQSIPQSTPQTYSGLELPSCPKNPEKAREIEWPLEKPSSVRFKLTLEGTLVRIKVNQGIEDHPLMIRRSE